MFANQVAKILMPATRLAAQKRLASSVVSGPPSVQVSKAEIRILGLVMLGSMVIIPGWVLSHIRAYRGLK